MCDVIYVVASMITGGTQTHLLQVFRLLDRNRFRPALFCLRDGGNLLPQVQALDVPVWTFGMRGTLKHAVDAKGLASMVLCLRRLRAQIVHGYLLRGNFYGAVAARLARTPVVVTSKRGLHRPAGTAERFAVRVSNRFSDTIVGNSPAVLDFTREVEHLNRIPLEMIPSGVDTERFDPGHYRGLQRELGVEGCPLIVTAITFRPRKGFRLLFEALAIVRRRIPRARLLLAGEERLYGPPAALATELGIHDAITLLGKRDDMPAVMATADVFVLPSESEGMSNAVLEAMAMERAVVATAVGGNRTVIEDGLSGRLVDYPDAQAMAARLVELLEDREKATRLGKAARRVIIARYSASSMVRQMEALYERLLDPEVQQRN